MGSQYSTTSNFSGGAGRANQTMRPLLNDRAGNDTTVAGSTMAFSELYSPSPTQFANSGCAMLVQ